MSDIEASLARYYLKDLSTKGTLQKIWGKNGLKLEIESFAMQQIKGGFGMGKIQ